MSYAEAVAEVERGHADGVGWLTQGDEERVWFDLDKCRNPETGAVDEWARDLLSCAPEAYHEVTPSGTGLRMVGRAGGALMGQTVNKTLRIDGAQPRAQVEIIYNSARYITVTGHALSACPIDGCDLSDLAAKLWAAALAQTPERKKGKGAEGIGEDKQAPIEDIRSALEAIGNGNLWDVCVVWEEWSRIGMAAFAASGGSADGLEAWCTWSARCEDKHDDAACLERWEHWGRSPPTELGFGALALAAGASSGGRWRRPSRAPAKEFSREEGSGEDDAGPPGIGGTDRAGGGGAGVDADLTPFMRLVARIIYVLKLDRFFDEVTRELLNESRLCAVASELGVEGFAGTGQKRLWAQLMGHPGRVLRRAVGMTMRPGQGLLVQEEEGLCVNLWQPSTLVPSDGDASMFIEHAERLIPDAAERKRALDRAGFLAQHPGVKINSALVFLGPQEAGKDTFLDPVFAMLGTHNMEVVQGHKVDDEFNDFLKAAHLLISEMPSYRKRSCYEEIKGWLTTPPERIRVNPKGTPAYSIRNLINVVVTTNHFDAIALAEDDRRFDVITTVAAGGTDKDEVEAYFNRLHRWLAAGGREAVAGALLRRDVSGFNPKARPPVSAAKAVMIREAEPAAMAWARSLWDEQGPLRGRMLVTLDELVELARRGAWGANGQMYGRGMLSQFQAALRADGWVNTGVQILLRDGRPRPWVRAKPFELYQQMSPIVLREKLEEDRRLNSAAGDF